MKYLRYSQQQQSIPLLSRVGRELQLLNKIPKLTDVIYVLLPLSTLILWSLSLKYINIRLMNDLGLVSVLPLSTLIALVILTVSFCLTLRLPKLRGPLLLLHLVLLIFMLYGITTLVEEAPRYTIVYRHAGFTEYIMRTGSVDTNLDVYFNWPGFFILSAFVTRIAGYQDVLGLANWAPVFFNLIYLGPMYMIFTSATTDRRLIWLGLWFFYVTNWIWQDYFSPQGFNFFLYLVIIAILLKWFKVPPRSQSNLQRQRSGLYSFLPQRLYEWLTAPDTLYTPGQPQQRIALLVIIILVFALVVFSHPLTPFFVLASITALVIFRRCTPRWLPILMAIMTAAWTIFMAQPFLAGHLNLVLGSFGNIGGTIATNVTNRVVQGSPEHDFIATIRVIMTAAVWGLALLGAVRRLRKGYHDVNYILLAVAPFPLLVAQPYGGEMLLRIYLFTLPVMVFFAASLFYTRHTFSSHGMSLWKTAAIAGTSLMLLGGFLFTRYGNERMDYMTYAEVNGIHYLYSIAPPKSLFIEGWNDTPWKFQNYEKYAYYSMTDDLGDAVRTDNVDSVVRFIKRENYSATYLIFARSQKATVNLYSELLPGALDRLEEGLLKSGKFKMIYSNPDIQILIFVDKEKR